MAQRSFRILASVAVLAWWATPSAIAQLVTTSEATLTASDAAANDNLGESVALSGSTLVVGSPHDDTAGLYSGSAYVFVWDGASWSEQAKLTALDAAAFGDFGRSVSIAGNTLVVGANAINGVGAAYVFIRHGATWSEQAELTASDGAAGDDFGYSVSASGNTVVVGARVKDAGAGAAYVFVRSGTTWSQQATLSASDATAGDSFGHAVALSGDTVVAGAVHDSAAVASSGSAYVFVRTGTSWSEQAKLTASDAATDDTFGFSVSVSGDTAVVGAKLHGSGAGSAYVFVRNGATWNQQATLTASDAAANDNFGSSVGVAGDVVIVGAPLSEGAQQFDVGSAYVFVRSTMNWTEQAKLTAPDGLDTDHFGQSVAVSVDHAVAGAPGKLSNSGGAYVWAFEPIGSWMSLAYGMAGTAGLPTLSGAGFLQASSPVTLSLAHARPLSLSPLVVGVGTIAAPFKGGIMVPSPDFIFPLFSDLFGNAAFGGPWPSGIPSGFSTYFQWWIQDPAGPKGFAASNAVAGTTP